jgi:diguanylate cyclase (GGDEF)-like protein
MDLDNFKVINDSLGHKAGDRLLVEVGKRLRDGKRPKDTVARIGGDEFVVLLEDLDEGLDAARAAERLVEGLRAPFEVEGQEVFAEVSVGVALGVHGDDADDLLRSADIAMYRAKHGGKGRVRVFDRDMDAEARERLELENELRRAVERGELVLHYQPEVLLEADLARRPRPIGNPVAAAARAPEVEPRVVAMEALVRWEHPERGLVPPAKFIPLAEETGLIVPLGRWVLEEACRQAKEWRARYPGDPLMMAVNVSARQFGHPDLVSWIEEALDHAGLAPNDLLLEITESVLMEDAEHNKATLERLKELGVALAIDDFGTGYSSLAYLRRFSVDYLKIDRSFVRGLGGDSGNEAIVLGMIGLAHAVGLKTVAEGVEFAEQLARLRAMRCDMAQGYHFARPMPRGAASQFLSDRFGVVDGTQAEPKPGLGQAPP